MKDIVANLNEVLENIKTARSKFRLPAGSDLCPQLIAVSKTHGAEKIIPLLQAGHKIYGENKVQEATFKWINLKQQFSDIKLHMIGPLQGNKVSEAVAIFDVIQSVDRKKLADMIAKEIIKTGKNIRLFIQVNTGDENQKSGISLNEVDDFIDYCVNDLKLPIIGLMCIPPFDKSATNNDTALHFALLAKIAKRHNLQHLSMGMSNDYQLATAMGASHIRVGTAIFGQRIVV